MAIAPLSLLLLGPWPLLLGPWPLLHRPFTRVGPPGAVTRSTTRSTMHGPAPWTPLASARRAAVWSCRQVDRPGILRWGRIPVSSGRYPAAGLVRDGRRRAARACLGRGVQGGGTWTAGRHERGREISRRRAGTSDARRGRGQARDHNQSGAETPRARKHAGSAGCAHGQKRAGRS